MSEGVSAGERPLPTWHDLPARTSLVRQFFAAFSVTGRRYCQPCVAPPLGSLCRTSSPLRCVNECPGEWPGPFVEEETGEVVGYHKGFWFHTVGQRKGVQLSGGPW